MIINFDNKLIINKYKIEYDIIKKYTFSGGIEVTFEDSINNDSLVKISVRDSGVGIPEEIMKRLF